MIQTPFINGPILHLTPFNLAGLVMRFSINKPALFWRPGSVRPFSYAGASGTTCYSGCWKLTGKSRYNVRRSHSR
jgi:hypothetical protein